MIIVYIHHKLSRGLNDFSRRLLRCINLLWNKFDFFTFADVIFSHKFDETENLWVVQSDKKTGKVDAAAFIDSSLNRCYLSPFKKQNRL